MNDIHTEALITAKKTIQPGDYVAWRSAKHPGSIGVRGCLVIELGTAESGEPAALIEVFGERVGALISDLTREQPK